MKKEKKMIEKTDKKTEGKIESQNGEYESIRWHKETERGRGERKIKIQEKNEKIETGDWEKKNDKNA